MIIGKGSYGKVESRDNKAVKTFSKLSHLLQECIALKYLDDCEFIVHSKGVNFANLELNMELYDCSLRVWLDQGPQGITGPRPSLPQILKILKDVLMGLIELHDRSLAHGDLKPSNILIRKSPLGAVLGDCGFVSIAKYAKVDRTAPIYRDPVISHDTSHDMYSFGILFLEALTDIKLNRQPTYEELKQLLHDKVTNLEYRKILYNLLHETKERRPSARIILHRLFNFNPIPWNKPSLLSSSSSLGRVHMSILNDDKIYIRKLVKWTANLYEINRGKKGYGALISHIDSHKIESSKFKLYTGVTLMILSAIFGKSGFREEDVIKLCENTYDKEYIYIILNKLISDDVFISILLSS